MSKPTIDMLDITPAQAGWDATIQSNFEEVESFLAGPLPVAEYLITADLPPVVLFDRCIVMLYEAGVGWRIRYSDGVTWLRVLTTSDTPTASVRAGVLRASAIADLSQTITDPPTQAEVQAISDKVDALLAALRTSGVLAT